MIKENIKNADIIQDKEVQVNLAKLRHEHEILKQKNKQVREPNFK